VPPSRSRSRFAGRVAIQLTLCTRAYLDASWPVDSLHRTTGGLTVPRTRAS